MPVLSRDEIKEGYVNTFGVKHDQLPKDTDLRVTNFFFEIVSSFLENGVSVIIEAAFQHKVWAPRMETITELADPFLILCSIDADLAAERHLRRGLENPEREFYHEDKRVAIFRATGTMGGPPAPYEPPQLDFPTLTVSTESDYSPSLDEIIAATRAQR